MLFRSVRAVTRPYPGAFSFLGSEKLLVWWAKPVSEERPVRDVPPGKLVPGAGPPAAASVGRGGGGRRRRLLVGTGEGLLSLEEIEWKGAVARGEKIVSLLADAGEERFQ